MGVYVRNTEFTARSGTGLQSVTFSDVPAGEDCKGYILFITQAVANGSEDADMNMGIGFVDSSGSMRQIYVSGENAVGTTISRTNSAIFAMLTAINNSVYNVIVANHDAFITDGFRIDVTTEVGDASCKAIGFFGDDVNMDRHTIAQTNTDNAESTVTVTQQADLLFVMERARADEASQNNDCRLSFGVASKKGGVITQFGSHFVSPNFKSTSLVAHAALDTRVAALVDAGGTNVVCGYELTTMNATTIGITTRINGETPADNVAIQLLSVNFGGAVDFDVGALSLPSSAGDNAHTGVGFKPQFVLMGMLQTNTYQEEGEARPDHALAHFGMADGSEEFCVGVNGEDNVGTTNMGSIIDTKMVRTLDQVGADEHTGTFKSFDSDGWTTNYTDAPTAYVGFWLAVGAQPGVQGLAAHIYQRRLSRRRRM